LRRGIESFEVVVHQSNANDRQLPEEMNRQLEAKNIIMTEGRINIIDATPIEAKACAVLNRDIYVSFQ